MSEVILPAGGVNSASALVQLMAATLRGYWKQSNGYQRFLYLVGAILVASGLFHIGVVIATDGSLDGPVSWRKPIVFGLSAGVTHFSLAWVMGFLPMHRVRGWIL